MVCRWSAAVSGVAVWTLYESVRNASPRPGGSHLVLVYRNRRFLQNQDRSESGKSGKFKNKSLLPIARRKFEKVGKRNKIFIKGICLFF